ncbi:MAG: hypothetical protein C0618_00415 [Desulfuromonas sp.]|nr:MAG: hypothetical protein C0618_00415 [Desulfuromonas sp.]
MENEGSRELSTMRTRYICMSLLLFFSVLALDAQAFFLGKGDVVAVVNEESLTIDDFANWWKEWEGPGMEVPESPDEYIDWVLMAQEANQMQLYENSSFQTKVDVFLKVQSLMMLRKEEITDKILDPADADLKKYYQGHYAPFLNLRMLALKTDEELTQVKDLIAQGKSLDEVARVTGYTDSERYAEETGEMRPLKIPEILREVALQLEPGQIGKPIDWKKATYFIELLSSREGTTEDFNSVKEKLLSTYRKSEDVRLTETLIDDLKIKYQVKVDQEVLQQITVDGVSEGATEKTAIKIGETEIKAEKLYQTALKQMRVQSAWTERAAELFQVSLDGVVIGAITQTLLGKESLDRKYQERPPLQSVFDFYWRNRLIKELEKELLHPLVSISDEYIQKEYEQHPENYSEDVDLVEAYIVDTKSEKLAAVLAERLKAGEDFATVMKVLEPTGLEAQQTPKAHLPEEVRDALETMVPGQSVGPVASQGKLKFVKLIGHLDRKVMPLADVRNLIRSQLYDRELARSRVEYLQRLRENSSIKINQSAWKKARGRILENADAQN